MWVLFLSSFNQFIKRLMFLTALYCWISTQQKWLFKLFFVISYQDNWSPCLCISNSFQIQFPTKKTQISAREKVREQVRTSEPSCAAKPRNSLYSPKGNWNLCLSVTEIHSCQSGGNSLILTVEEPVCTDKQSSEMVFIVGFCIDLSTPGFDSTEQLHSGFVSKGRLHQFQSVRYSPAQKFVGT